MANDTHDEQPQPISDELLAEIRERANAAAPGPWSERFMGFGNSIEIHEETEIYASSGF